MNRENTPSETTATAVARNDQTNRECPECGADILGNDPHGDRCSRDPDTMNPTDPTAGSAPGSAVGQNPPDVRVSLEDVQARRYSYVSVTFHDPLGWAKVLVPKMPAAAARETGKRIAEARYGRVAVDATSYGPNYIRDARALVALGGIGYRGDVFGTIR